MSNQRYPEEFKIEAVKQVTDRASVTPRRMDLVCYLHGMNRY